MSAAVVFGGGYKPPPPLHEERDEQGVVRSPCQENYPADTHPSAHKSVLESASMDSGCASGRTGSTAQATASGTADPGVVKQEKSSRGSVDTTKTRSDPQRVRMSSGERPIGAAKANNLIPRPCAKPPHHHPPLHHASPHIPQHSCNLQLAYASGNECSWEGKEGHTPAPTVQHCVTGSRVPVIRMPPQ